MAIVVADRVKVRARTTGTGPFTIESTFPGFQGFEAVGDGNETYYGIFDVAGNWEVGQGTYTASGQTLTRDVIIASSNSGSVVDFPDGGKTLYVTVPSTILTTLAGSIPNSFLNIAVPGQSTLSADSPTDILTITGGAGISIITDDVTDTLTITSTATAQDTFKNIAVAGQNTVVADGSADTLTLVAGANITITTDDTTDSITIAGAPAGDTLPSQTGNAGKYLTTDGSNLSWSVVESGGGGGSSTSFDFTVAADDSTMIVINAGETLKIIGGDGITTSSNVEGAITVNASFSGSYLDLLNKPSIPVSLLDLGISDGSNGQVLTTNGVGSFSFQNITAGLAAVATSGSYNDLTDRPTIPSSVFSTLAVSGQSNIVADNTSDTLTIVAGTGISITTDAGNDTLTITNSSVGTTYSVSAETSGANTVLRLTGSDASTDDVIFAAGTDISIARTDANTITISSTATSGVDIGSFVFTGTNIDTDDSSGITITPTVTLQSDLTIQNELTVNNLTTINGQLNAQDIYFTGTINSQGSGTPEIFSDNEILLTAGTRVSVTSSPIKMASFTTAERDTLVPANGDMIYNSTTHKFQGYANGLWVDLH